MAPRPRTAAGYSRTPRPFAGAVPSCTAVRSNSSFNGSPPGRSRALVIAVVAGTFTGPRPPASQSSATLPCHITLL